MRIAFCFAVWSRTIVGRGVGGGIVVVVVDNDVVVWICNSFVDRFVALSGVGELL